MTLRDTLRSYFGWCPGFNRVIGYVPNEDVRLNFKWITLSTAIVLSIVIISSTMMSPPPIPISPGSPLQIYIGYEPKRGVYLDPDFNQTFDYSVFHGAAAIGPSFYQPTNATEYAKGSEIEIETYQFSTLDEVYEFTLRLDMPNAIRRYIRWLISQDYNTTALKVLGRVRANNRGAFGDDIGYNFYPPRNDYVTYSITRMANYGGINTNEGWDGTLVLTDGVKIVKSSNREVAWYLGIEGCAETPFTGDLRYRVRIVHYPKGNDYGTVIN